MGNPSHDRNTYCTYSIDIGRRSKDFEEYLAVVVILQSAYYLDK